MTTLSRPVPAPPADAARPPAAAYVCDDVTAGTLARLAAAAGWPKDAVRMGGLAAAEAELAREPTPRLLILDVSGAADPAGALRRLSEVCEAEVRVIALGTQNDVELFRALRAAGADDYLVKPVRAEAIERALGAAAEGEGGAARPRGRLVAVIGSRGGVGATTVAVNVAWLAARAGPRRVALLDLDLDFGTAGLALDLEPGPGLGEALENPGRIDELFVERAMVKADDRLYLLGAEEALAARPEPESAGLEVLAEALRGSFGAVFVDLPRARALRSPGVLAAASAIVLVSDLSLAGMRDTLRLAAFVRERAAGARLVVVANRAGEFPGAEVPRPDFERSLEAPIGLMIPYDPKAAGTAMLGGRVLCEAAGRKSGAARALRALAGELAGEGGRTARGRSWWPFAGGARR